MRTEFPPIETWVASILCLAVSGCSGSESGTAGVGGATSITSESGGAATSGTGGVAATGGASLAASGGATAGIGGAATGGRTTNNTGGTLSNSGGMLSTGGAAAGGPSATPTGGRNATGGSSATPTGGRNATGGSGAGTPTGGRNATGGSGAATPTGGRNATGGMSSSSGTGGGTFSGTCTASKSTGTNATGSGPHKVTVETNTDAGIKEGTIFRPTDLGGTEKYPIFVWGEGGCSENGLSNSAAMAEIASYGYFVVADGVPNGTASRSQTSDTAGMGKPLLAYVTWAIAENEKPCSAYYHSLDTTKIASNGFSCGGLMAEGTAGDPRITTWGLNSSGLFAADQPFYKTIHTPVLIVLGGSGDMAYTNGERDYTNISALGFPIMLFSKALGHGGDLFSARGGDFAKIDLAWLNWWLKGDLTATGKGLLVGSGCSYCTNAAWEVKSANLP